jgi:protein PhnA
MNKGAIFPLFSVKKEFLTVNTLPTDYTAVLANLLLEKPIMSTLPPCPLCNSAYTYQDGGMLVCPECAHEWNAGDSAEVGTIVEATREYRDSAGNLLQDGDTVTVIKDLKLKGGGGTVKMGTKVRNIRLVDGDHDIDCKIEGFGAMSLKTEFVRKV